MKNARIVLVAGLMTMFSMAHSQPHGEPQGERANHRQMREKDHGELNLSDEQREKAEELRLAIQKSSLPIQNELGENRAKLRTLTTAEVADMKAINKLIDESAELRAELAKLRAANHQEFRKILTEEQRIKFDNRSPRKFQQRRMQHGEMYRRGQQGQKRQFKGQLE